MGGCRTRFRHALRDAGTELYGPLHAGVKGWLDATPMGPLSSLRPHRGVRVHTHEFSCGHAPVSSSVSTVRAIKTRTFLLKGMSSASRSHAAAPPPPPTPPPTHPPTPPPPALAPLQDLLCAPRLLQAQAGPAGHRQPGPAHLRGRARVLLHVGGPDRVHRSEDRQLRGLCGCVEEWRAVLGCRHERVRDRASCSTVWAPGVGREHGQHASSAMG